jgi:hypothetical protein
MEVTIRRSAWGEIDAGLRTSTGLKFGAISLALCAAARLGVSIAQERGESLPGLMVWVPWWLFILALTVLGFAYLSLAWRPFFGYSAWMPGVAHLLQASVLITALYLFPAANVVAPYPPLLKYTGLAVFANMEAPRITPTTRVLLLVVALGELTKIVVRSLASLTPTVALALNLLLLAIQVIAIWQLSEDVAFHEDLWASEQYAELEARMRDLDHPASGSP